MKPWKYVRHTLYEFLWEPLFVGHEDIRVACARGIWFVWFTLHCLYTLHARSYSEPLSDSDFVQAIGIVSAAAILISQPTSRKIQRLHVLMLTLSCIVFLTLQRPAGFTPHGRFLRSFGTIRNGMTTGEVASIMRNGTISADDYLRWSLPVSSDAAHRKWLHPGYSGRLRFSHNGPGIDGFFWVDFQNGLVISTYCFNE
jgi:hypothetical protein